MRETLQELDYQKIAAWYNMHSDAGTELEIEDVKTWLRQPEGWLQNKSQLFKILGENLVLEIPVDKETSLKEKNFFAKEALDSYFIHAFDEYFYSNGWKHPICSDDPSESLALFSLTDLINNKFDHERLSRVVNSMPTDLVRRMKLNTKSVENMKILKYLKILSETFLTIASAYDVFRTLHSRINGRIKGVLCLSIHPMDYLTLSDNEYKWKSCVSVSKKGDYRSGVLSMLESKTAIVAYVKGDKEMQITKGDEDDALYWNSKKWRQLVYVDENFIIGSRQYPTAQMEISNLAIGWLSDLCEDFFHDSFSTECEMTSEHFRGIENIDTTETKIGTIAHGNMYSDFGRRSSSTARLSEHFKNAKKKRVDLDFGELAKCPVCENEIVLNDGLCCCDCSGEDEDVTCCECGNGIYLEDAESCDYLNLQGNYFRCSDGCCDDAW